VQNKVLGNIKDLAKGFLEGFDNVALEEFEKCFNDSVKLKKDFDNFEVLLKQLIKSHSLSNFSKLMNSASALVSEGIDTLKNCDKGMIKVKNDLDQIKNYRFKWIVLFKHRKDIETFISQAVKDLKEDNYESIGVNLGKLTKDIFNVHLIKSNKTSILLNLTDFIQGFLNGFDNIAYEDSQKCTQDITTQLMPDFEEIISDIKDIVSNKDFEKLQELIQKIFSFVQNIKSEIVNCKNFGKQFDSDLIKLEEELKGPGIILKIFKNIPLIIQSLENITLAVESKNFKELGSTIGNMLNKIFEIKTNISIIKESPILVLLQYLTDFMQGFMKGFDKIAYEDSWKCAEDRAKILEPLAEKLVSDFQDIYSNKNYDKIPEFIKEFIN
jgi:hypothetical protein